MFEVESITSYDNDGGSGILARVNIKVDEGPNKDISVWVEIPLNVDLSLKTIESLIIEAAKEKLRKVML
jgi:hypothetical protein